MTRLFQTGFESGSINVFHSVAGSPTIETAQVRTGTYSMLVNTTERGGIWLTTAISEFYLRIAIRPIGYYEVPFALYGLDEASGVQFSVTVTYSTGTLNVYRGETAYLLGSAAGVLPPNEWRVLELRYKVDNSSGVAQAKVDGTLVVDFSGDTQQTAYANVQQIYVGAGPSANRRLHAYYDDIALNDTNGAVNNSWIGLGGIYGLVPTAAGASTDLTPSAGANYECVDEKPPNSDTDYVESDVVDDHDSYTMADLVPTTGTISAVSWLCYAKQTDSGTASIARVIDLGGTAPFDGSDTLLTEGYTYFRDVIELNPGSTAAWTITDVNGLEAGVKIRG